MTNMQVPSALRALIVILSTLGLLTACGSGGGGDSESPSSATPAPAQTPTPEPTPQPAPTPEATPAPAPSFTPSALQGRWSLVGATAATSYTAIVLPGSNNTANVWLLNQSVSELSILSVDNQATLSGKVYALSGTAAPATATGTVVAKLDATPKTLALSGTDNTARTLSLQDALSEPASLTDSAGSWTGSVGNGAQTLSLSIAGDTGTLSGASTTGCTYTGSLTAISNANAFTSTLDESCPDGSITRFEGIATLNGSKNRLTLVGATSAKTSGIVLLLGK